MKEELKDQIHSSYESIGDKLQRWVDTFILNLPNLVVAIVVFTLAYILSGLIRKYLKKFLARFIEQPSLRSLIATIVSVVIIAMGLFIALGVLNLDTVLKSMLAGAGVAGLAIGLALQSSLSNTFSGISLSLRDIINVGDWIETNGYSGAVVEITLRNVVIKEPDNNLVMIPNKMVVENPFKNFGLTDRIRVILKCGVGYESDLHEVENIAITAIKEQFPTDKSENIEFHYLEFGDSSINFQLRFWVDATSKLTILEAKSKGIKIIKDAFDEKGINIPFPIRTLQISASEIKKLKTSANQNDEKDEDRPTKLID